MIIDFNLSDPEFWWRALLVIVLLGVSVGVITWLLWEALALCQRREMKRVTSLLRWILNADEWDKAQQELQDAIKARGQSEE